MHIKTANCVNSCSNLENNNEIYSLAQYEASKFKVEESNGESDQSNVGDSRSNNDFEKDSSDHIKNNNNTNTSDNYKEKLLKCTKEPKLEEELESQQQQNQRKNPVTVNKNSEIESHSIKAANSPPVPPLNPTADNNPNKTTNTLYLSIKSENTSTIIVNPNTTSTTDLATHPRDNLTKSIEVNKPSVNKDILSTSLSRRNGQLGYIISNDNNVNNNNNSNNNFSNKKNLLIPKSLEENRPKSVTASVFRPAALADLNTTHSTTASPQSQSAPPPSNTSTSSVFVCASNAPLPHMNAASRAQSVTASVFTPISQLCNRQQQHIVKTNSIITPTTVTATILSGQHHPHPQPQPQQQQSQDMNKFLSFGDDATELTMLKEEPDDLPSLAPAAVDACMRLNGTAPFCDEMLLGLCSYSYSGFLPDDYSSLDSNTNCSSPDTPNNKSNSSTAFNKNNNNENSTNNDNNKIDLSSPKHQDNCSNNTSATTLHNNSSNHMCNKPVVRVDPFINYREESNDTSCSQHLLSPSMASKSPEASSLPSLCSPNSLSQDDGFAFMTMSVDEDIDMSMRAPYIPMNEQEDLPLLTADDLMWCASNGLCNEELNNQKDVDVTLQQLQLQQQHSGDSNHNLLTGYQDAQHISQSNFNSLCSSPASTVSSISPSPVNNHQQQQPQQQQQQDANSVYSTDTSELAALLCGSGNGQLSILNNNCGGSGGRSGDENVDAGQQQQQQQQSHCDDYRLQQLQQELASDQQEQQRRLLLGLSIDCKKENALSPNICDSLEDTFDNVYSKDSTNLDCWNELLQINVNDSSSSASASPVGSLSSPSQHHKPQKSDDCKSHLRLEQNLSPQNQHHNIILNAVPLIAIQDTKNILLQQHDNNNKMLINDGISPTNRGSNKITAIKMSNDQTATTITKTATPIATPLPASVGTALRKIDFKQQQQQQQVRVSNISKSMLMHQQLQQQQHQTQQSHKRHLENSLANSQQGTKRMKSICTAKDGIEHAIPQLLQQLVAPVYPQQMKEQQQKQQQQQQTRKINAGNSDSSHSGWPIGGDTKTAIIMQQQQQQSNSVLKNLLISGCDTSKFTKQKCLVMDEDSLDQPLSALSPSLTKPLHCQTSTAAVLRNYRHNPMIGGPGVLPSPPFGPIINSDSYADARSSEVSPLSLTPVDTESTSDSGIDDISVMETSVPIKIQVDKSIKPSVKLITGCSAATKDMLLMKCLNNKAIKKLASMDLAASEPQLKQQQFSSQTTVKGIDSAAAIGIINDCGNSKDSVTTFSDNINPLMEPFIMDLCNDDYDVSTEPFLGPNEIDNVLNDWAHEMA